MERENMRVIVSKRMIREGLLRCLEKKSIDKITVTELCREAQVNRTTFYNHYDLPKDVLDEISWDMVMHVEEIFQNNKFNRASLIKVLELIDQNREMLKILFSANVEYPAHKMIVQTFPHFWDKTVDLRKRLDLNETEYRMVTNGYGWAGYHILRQWVMEEIDMTPEQMVNLFDKMFSGRLEV